MHKHGWGFDGRLTLNPHPHKWVNLSMKKRVLCVLFAGLMLFCLLIEGCSATKKDSYSENVKEQSSAETNNPFTQLQNLVSPDQRFTQAGTEDGAYIRMLRSDWTETLFFIDYDTKIGVPLCSQANCTHNNDSCTAWLPTGWNTQFVLNGRLYVFCDNSRQNEELLEMDLNGQNRRQILKLESNEHFSAAGVVGNERYLFFGVQKMMEDTGWPEYSIRRLELATGKLETIHQRSDGTNNTVTLQGACGENLVVKYVDAEVVFKDNTDPSDTQIIEMYCIDQNGERLPGDYPAWPKKDQFIYYAGTCLYRTNSAEGTLTIYNFADGSETTFQDDRLRTSRVTQVVEGFPEGLIISVSSEDRNDFPHWYLYHDGSLIASQYVALNEKDTRLKNLVIADAGQYYLVQRDFSQQHPQYCLVAKEDFWEDANTGKDIPIQIQLP